MDSNPVLRSININLKIPVFICFAWRKKRHVQWINNINEESRISSDQVRSGTLISPSPPGLHNDFHQDLKVLS